MGSSAVRTENLTKRYGRLTALDGLHLEVGAGEVCGFSAPESRHGRARPSSTPDSPSARHWPASGTCSRSRRQLWRRRTGRRCRAPRRSRGLSPFTHLATVPDRPVNWPAAAVMTGIGLAAIGAGAAGYRRRDLLR